MKPADFNNDPFMYYAAVKNKLAVVKALIAAGADIEPNHPEWLLNRPLATAAAMGYTDIVRVLVEAGADVNAKEGRYLSPLDAAYKFKFMDIVKILENAGARGGTPISGGRKKTRKYKNKNRKTRRKA